MNKSKPAYIICLTTTSSNGSRTIHSLWKGDVQIEESFFRDGDRMPVGQRKEYLSRCGYVRIR